MPFPIDATFRRVVDTLKQGREVEYGFLGIQPTNLSPAGDAGGQARHAGAERGRRARPPSASGLQTDDVITAVDGRPILTIPTA